MKRLPREFYTQNALSLAPNLLGKYLVTKDHGIVSKYRIEDIEVYLGEEDLACHASKGRTKRTEIMYHEGGYIYMYLIYGIHWMFNIVCGQKEEAQAILIRGIENFDGPGKLTKALQLDNSYYGENLCSSNRIWIEDYNSSDLKYTTGPRVGISYAGEPWISKPWRFQLK